MDATPQRKDGAKEGIVALTMSDRLAFDGILLVSETERHVCDTVHVIQRARPRVDRVAVFIVEDHVLEVEGHAGVLVCGSGLAVFAGTAEEPESDDGEVDDAVDFCDGSLGGAEGLFELLDDLDGGWPDSAGGWVLPVEAGIDFPEFRLEVSGARDVAGIRSIQVGEPLRDST